MNALVPQAGGRSATTEPQQYLTFMLGGEVFAIGILAIKEIIEYGGITPVPMMPSTIRGVINLRGAVVPVMDLAARFGRPSAEVSKRTCIVIVELRLNDEQQVIGVIVDSVNAVQEIAPADIEPAPGFGMRVAPQFIAGMGKVGGKFVILLDIEQVLSLHDMEQLQALTAAGS
ncbi:purine-binding chemotaxis protein CheW [Pelomonas saccharophila]|uniref:Purine-binding chemotaxis protein CheW n=1 Tax=Roseateles saccharophilus TaxID=304 RepID=A0ABU1YWS8_ROSSA|nr:chemotaxis protein CheW [Roseateles saccharophilus]MDR7272486.1 purine-binding chemotaxis protein CheW [Roseateles saccharophilus]